MFQKQIEWFQGEPEDVPGDKVRQDHPYMRKKNFQNFQNQTNQFIYLNPVSQLSLA